MMSTLSSMAAPDVVVMEMLHYWYAPTDLNVTLNVSDDLSMVIDARSSATHDDVIKWKHFPRYLSFVRGIHRSPVDSPRKDQ